MLPTASEKCLGSKLHSHTILNLDIVSRLLSITKIMINLFLKTVKSIKLIFNKTSQGQLQSNSFDQLLAKNHKLSQKNIVLLRENTALLEENIALLEENNNLKLTNQISLEQTDKSVDLNHFFSPEEVNKIEQIIVNYPETQDSWLRLTQAISNHDIANIFDQLNQIQSLIQTQSLENIEFVD